MLNKKSFLNRIFGNQNNSKFKERKSRRLSLENLEVRALLSVSPYTPPSQNNEDDTSVALVEPLVDSHRQVTFDDTLQVDFSTQSQLDDTATAPQLETVAAAAATAETEVSLPVEVEAQASSGGQTELVSLESQLQTPDFIYAKATDTDTIRIQLTYRAKAESYRVRYSSDDGATWSDAEVVSQTTDGSNPIYRIQGLKENTTYKLKARSISGDSSHTSSDWVEYNGSVTTYTALKSVTLSTNSPSVNNTITASVTPSGATCTYQWSYSTSKNGTFTDISGATSASFTPTFTYLGTYLKCTVTGTAPYAKTASAVTASLVTKQLNAPNDLKVTECSNSTIRLSWNYVSNATSYILTYSTSPDFSNSQSITGITSTSTTVAKTVSGLASGTTYYFKVGSVGTGNYTNSEYTSTVTGTTKGILSTPTLDTPVACNDLNASMSVSFTAVAGAGSYKIKYRPVDESEDAQTITVTTTSATISHLTLGKRYKVWVQAVSSNTSSYDDSAWSDPKGTVHPIRKKLNTPNSLKSTGTAENSVSLSWGNVSNASSFMVEYSTSSSFASSSTKTFSSNSGTISGLASGTTYYFRVKSVGADYYVDSDYSDAVTATTSITKISLKGVSLSTNTLQIGDTVTASVNPSGATCTYQWSYSTSQTGTFTNISGATSATFTTYMGLTGKYLRCTVTGTGNYTGTVTATTTETVKHHLLPPQFENDTPTVIGSNTIHLELTYRADAGSYRVQYSSDDGETWSTSITVDQTTGTNPVCNIKNLPDGIYTIRVRSIIKDGDVEHTNSDWRESDYVTIGKIDSPTLNNLTADGYTISASWSTVSKADEYRVEYKLSTDSDEDWCEADTVSGTSLTFSVDEGPGTYQVRVIAIDENYNESDSSNIQSIQIVFPAPVLSSLTANGYTISASWSNVSVADEYRVEYKLSTDSDEDWCEADTVSGTSLTFPVDEGPGTYQVRVIAIDEYYNESQPSNSKTVEVVFPAPELTGLTASGYTVSASWGKVNDADEYRVEYKLSTDDDWYEADTVSDTTLDFDVEEGAGTYQVRVIAIDEYGNESAPSNVQTIEIGPVPAPALDKLEADGLTISASWSEVALADEYRVEYKLSTDDEDDWYVADTVSDTELEFDVEEGAGTYQVRVIAIDANYNESEPSNIQSIEIGFPAPILDELEVDGLIISASWSEVDIASEYRVEYKLSTDDDWFEADTVSDTTLKFDADLGAGTYQVRVIVIDENYNESTPSNIQSIKIIDGDTLSTPELYELDVDGTTVFVSWSEVENASGYQLEYKLSTATEWTTQTVTGTSATFTGTEGATYNVRVKALGTGQYTDSEYSQSKSVTIPEEITDQIQQVYSNNVNAIVGSTITIPVYYEVKDGNTNLTGLNLRVHYDSSKLQFEGYSDCLETSNTRTPTDDTDDDNDDGSTTTDKVIRIDWLDMTASPAWPGVDTPVLLANLTFTVKAEDADTTVINYTGDGAYTVEGKSTEITIVKGNFDIDGNGKLEPLKDGLLLYRYLSKFKGNTLTQYAIGKNATRTTADEVTAYLDSIKSILDIDGNGKLEPLKDGLLLYRYLSKFKGDTLTQYAIGKNATRTTADEISEYIASFSTIQSSAAEVAPTTMLDSSKVSMEVPTTVTVLETPDTQVESKMVEQKSEPVNVQTELTAKDSASVLASATLRATDSIFDGWDEFTQEDDDSIDFVIESELKTVLK